MIEQQMEGPDPGSFQNCIEQSQIYKPGLLTVRLLQVK